GQQVLVEHPGAHDLHRRNLQALLVNLGYAEGHAAGREATHIHPVRLTGRDREELAVDEDRPYDAHVVEVTRASGIGRIQNDGIAGLEGVWRKHRERGPHTGVHGAQVEWRAAPLAHGDDVAV